MNYEFGYKLVLNESMVVEDEWVLDEPGMRLIRLHKKNRVAKYVPTKDTTPIKLDFLDSSRETIIQYDDGGQDKQDDDWKVTIGRRQERLGKNWKGRTIFKILPGGLENRTSVRVSHKGTGPKRHGSPDDEVKPGPSSVKKRVKSKSKPSTGSSPIGEVPAQGGSPLGEVPKEDPAEFVDAGYSPTSVEEELPASGSSPIGEETM